MTNIISSGRTYYVRARHKTTNGLVSPWSPTVKFRTTSDPRPVVENPNNANSTEADGSNLNIEQNNSV
jgi:hypothetical protein